MSGLGLAYMYAENLPFHSLNKFRSFLAKAKCKHFALLA